MPSRSTTWPLRCVCSPPTCASGGASGATPCMGLGRMMFGGTRGRKEAKRDVAEISGSGVTVSQYRCRGCVSQVDQPPRGRPHADLHVPARAMRGGPIKLLSVLLSHIVAFSHLLPLFCNMFSYLSSLSGQSLCAGQEERGQLSNHSRAIGSFRVAARCSQAKCARDSDITASKSNSLAQAFILNSACLLWSTRSSGDRAMQQRVRCATPPQTVPQEKHAVNLVGAWMMQAAPLGALLPASAHSAGRLMRSIRGRDQRRVVGNSDPRALTAAASLRILNSAPRSALCPVMLVRLSPATAPRSSERAKREDSPLTTIYQCFGWRPNPCLKNKGEAACSNPHSGAVVSSYDVRRDWFVAYLVALLFSRNHSSSGPLCALSLEEYANRGWLEHQANLTAGIDVGPIRGLQHLRNGSGIPSRGASPHLPMQPRSLSRHPPFECGDRDAPSPAAQLACSLTAALGQTWQRRAPRHGINVITLSAAPTPLEFRQPLPPHPRRPRGKRDGCDEHRLSQPCPQQGGGRAYERGDRGAPQPPHLARSLTAALCLACRAPTVCRRLADVVSTDPRCPLGDSELAAW